MASVQTAWRYSLIDSNETKAAVRTATPKDLSWEQIGMDGSALGGKRPHPGFKFFRDLTGTIGEEFTQTISDFYPVTFRASSTEYAYGFVYRIKDGTEETCKYFLEYTIGQSGVWLGPVDLVDYRSDGNQQMNVTVYGRFVYVFVSGSQPFYFFLDEDPPSTFTLVTITDTGPGIAPETFKQDFHVAATVDDSDIVLDETDFFVDPPIEGRGRFLHFLFWKDDVTWATPLPPDENFRIAGTFTYQDSDDALNGPSDLMGGSSPQADPSLKDWDIGPNFPIGVQFIGDGGGEDSPSPIVTSKGEDPAGTDRKIYAYAYAYVLYDSRTGRKSAPSGKHIMAYGPLGAYTPWITETSASATSGEQIGWGAIDVLYDPLKYDTILMYRSVAIPYAPSQAEVPNVDEFFLKLDSIRALDDYDVDTPTVPTGFLRSLVFYHLSNSEIATQDDLIEEVYLADMPSGGSSLFYEKTMLVGKTGALTPDIGGLGTFHWSSLLALSVELFKASDRYLMTLPDEEVERFLFLGPNVIAMTKHGLYLVRRETIFLKAFPIAQGYGIVGDRAATTVGSSVFYMTHQGLKTLDSDGMLSDVDAMNHIVQEDWKGTLSQVEIAFDPTYKVLTVLNPELEHAVLFWMQTGQVTELLDCNFAHVTEGNIPFDSTDNESPLESRTCFVQVVQPNVALAQGWTWRVYTMDYARQKTLPTMLHPSGPVIMSSTDAFTSGVTLTVDGAGFGSRLEGCKLYVLDGDMAGAKATIVKRISGGEQLELAAAEAPDLYGIPVGTRLGISPMYFRWVGYQLDLRTAEGVQFMDPMDYFETRHADCLGCVFVDVQNNGFAEIGENDLRYRALLYVGNAVEPVTKAFPLTEDSGKFESIVEGASPRDAAFCSILNGVTTSPGMLGRYGYASHSLFPGVEVFVPGIDYRLLQVKVKGKIMPQEASGESS